MMFNIIRIILWIIVSLITIVKIRNSKIVKKKLTMILILIVYLVFFSVSAMFPLENAFIDFKSPESVFNYTCFGTIEKIIDGQESCMIIYSKGNNTFGVYFVPKKEKVFKIPTYFATKKIMHKFDEKGLIDVYVVKGTKDYYVSGTLDLQKGENEIYVVNINNEIITNDIFKIKNTNYIFFFLEEYSKDYFLTVNGEKISFNKTE